MPGRKAALVVADQALQDKLVRLIHQSSAQQRLVFRARIVLEAMQGHSNTQIAAQLNVNLSSVSKSGRWADTQTLPLTEMPLENRLHDAPLARQTGADWPRSPMPDHGDCLAPRTMWATDHAVDGAGTRRRSPRAGDCADHFAPPCRAFLKASRP